MIAALASALAVPACGSDGTGVDACKHIEEARCKRASSCGIAIAPPYSTSGSPADACIRFYDVACLHGLEAPLPMKSAQVDACVIAIGSSKSSCTIVVSPETNPACAWLLPPSTADASDGTGDAATEATGASE
jgi:hypothetical protein